MTPPRWSTPYADRVRRDLVHLVEHGDPAAESRRPARAAERSRVVVTGAVAVLVAVAAVLAIRAGLDRPPQESAVQPSRDATSASPQPTRPQAEVEKELQDALFAILPASARSAPSFTWTPARVGPTGGAIETDGRTVLLAAACEGGGTLTLTVTGLPDTVLRCADLSTAGPIDLSAAGGTDPPGQVEYDVTVTSGSPRYFAKAVAIDSEDLPSDAATP